MKLIDFHTHHPSLAGERVIQDGIDTRGRHPWHLTPSPSQRGDESHIENDGRRLLAIGESGLDKVCNTPYDLQLQVFREEVALSETLRLPLFLHCVRAIDDVLRIRQELHAQQPCIWHGYRGNAQQIKQLLPIMGENGKGVFYFSFGLRYNEQALLACPLDRMLLETDDDTLLPIAKHYAQVAQLRGITLESLINQMHTNFRTLFGDN